MPLAFRVIGDPDADEQQGAARVSTIRWRKVALRYFTALRRSRYIRVRLETSREIVLTRKTAELLGCSLKDAREVRLAAGETAAAAAAAAAAAV